MSTQISQTYPTSPTGSATTCTSPTHGSWQERLNDYCSQYQITPVWEVYSDRRGGRTAWSSGVTVDGERFLARFWYDGNYVHNAKEDAAEVALIAAERRRINVQNP